jgi:hypothetical protein
LRAYPHVAFYPLGVEGQKFLPAFYPEGAESQQNVAQRTVGRPAAQRQFVVFFQKEGEDDEVCCVLEMQASTIEISAIFWTFLCFLPAFYPLY